MHCAGGLSAGYNADGGVPMSDRKPTSVVPWIAGIVPLLLGVYVGAYYMMVRTPGQSIVRKIDVVDPPIFHECITTIRTYQWPSLSRFEAGPTLFAPMESLDRRIRPHVWNSPWEDDLEGD